MLRTLRRDRQKNSVRLKPCIKKIVQAIRETFDFTPQGMTETLELQKPIFCQTANYGHFGRNHGELPYTRQLTVILRNSACGPHSLFHVFRMIMKRGSYYFHR